MGMRRPSWCAGIVFYFSNDARGGVAAQADLAVRSRLAEDVRGETRDLEDCGPEERPDSLFHPMVLNFTHNASPGPSSRSELQSLGPELVQLCKLDDASTQDNNPYLASVSFLARTINVDCNIQNVGMFLSFFSSMNPDFKHLLGRKDPCALLLLAHWYAKMCHYHEWWIWRRAYLEGQSICTYLTRYHGDDGNILNAMKYPEMVCCR